MSPVLVVKELSVRFGGVQALSGVNLEVGEGELVGLIGPNGAGKTTLIDAITGFVGSSGRVELDGADLAGATPSDRARRGLGRTWQASELFDDLNVYENLAVAATRPAVGTFVRELFGRPVAPPPGIDEALALVQVGWARDRMPSELTQGQRKLVGVARAIAMRPRVLCLDEPAAGLDTRESQALGERLRRLADDGTSTLLIDHDMGLVLSICDTVFVLEFGEVIGSGPPDVVRRDPRVIAAYLGSSATPEVAG